MIYVLHFDKPLHHARHYIGFVESEDGLASRMEYHKSGRGSKLLRAVVKAGIGWTIVATMEGDRNFERKLKNRKNASKLCPICRRLKDENQRVQPGIDARSNSN